MIGIYLIENPKGLVYIGQSTNIERRLYYYSKLSCKDQSLLYNSLQKYGFENHKVEVLCECDVSELNERERMFIQQYQSNNRKFGLNLTTGGQDYWNHTEETKLRMSEAQKGNKKAFGFKQSEETIAKRTSKTRGKKRSDAFRKRLSEVNLGKKLSKEQREAMSKRMKGKNAKQVVDDSTGVIYSSAVEAADKNGIKRSTLVARLNGQCKNKTTFRYL